MSQKQDRFANINNEYKQILNEEKKESPENMLDLKAEHEKFIKNEPIIGNDIKEEKPIEMKKKKGNKHEVYHGLALKTAGGLCKDDLMENKRGAIISKKKSEQGKKLAENLHNPIKSQPEKPKILDIEEPKKKRKSNKNK